MYNNIRKIKANSLFGDNLEELEAWMDIKFDLNISINKDNSTLIENEFDYNDRSRLDIYGNKMRKKCPDSLGMSLFYIRQNTDYPNLNHIGKYCLYHVWPLFFEKFPLGQIWIIETPKYWWEEIWKGQRELAIKSGYNQINPGGISPQELTGLLSDEFLYNSLNILSYGFYPLILSNCFSTGYPSGLTFLYIPDRTFEYSQMNEANTLYSQTLWGIFRIFDDQWTFDSSRGPKSSIDPVIMNPINQLDYFQWFFEKIDERMIDILSIEDNLLREKLVMTMNRAIIDSQIAVTSELPYISKVFFFNFLDKAANIMTILNMGNTDTEAWEKLVDPNFIKKNVLKVIENIPNNAGEYLMELVKSIVVEFETEDIKPVDLRDMRNTNHGYNLKKQSVDRLMEKDGEISNDITLLATPLILYLFSIHWKI
jgi:hypothetical protein